MKHPIKQTALLILWIVFSVAVGILAIPRILEITPETSFINPWIYIGIVLGLILVATFGWLQMMKRYRPETVDFWFAVGMGALSSRVVGLVFPNLYESTGWTGFLIRLAMMPIFIYLFWKMVKQMQKSWFWVRKLNSISNFWTSIIIAVAAALIAVDIAPWVAIIMLGVAAFYDAWAVWKTKHMQRMALFFIKRRLIPGLAVPYDDGKTQRFAMIGGGDIFFIVLVATSFYKADILTMYTTAITMTSVVIGLFLFSKKNTFYPALPFIFVGLILGIVVRLLL